MSPARSSRTPTWSASSTATITTTPTPRTPAGAELILAKHRNGPVGTVRLVFLEHYPKFADRAREEKPLEQPAGEGPPLEDIAGAEDG